MILSVPSAQQHCRIPSLSACSAWSLANSVSRSGYFTCSSFMETWLAPDVNSKARQEVCLTVSFGWNFFVPFRILLNLFEWEAEKLIAFYPVSSINISL